MSRVTYMRAKHGNSPPRLVPTGNVDEVLFTGKSRGKSLTLFQSVGLAIFGVCFVLGIGIPAIVFEFQFQSELHKMGLSYPKRISYLECSFAFLALRGWSWA